MSQFRKQNFKTSNGESLKFLLNNRTGRKCYVQNKKNSLFIASTIITMLTSKNMIYQFKAKYLILSYKILSPKTNYQHLITSTITVIIIGTQGKVVYIR